LLKYSELGRVEQTPEKGFQRLLKKLRFKYRLVVMNDETYEERYSLKLSQLNLFTALGLLAITLVLVTTWVIAFTPLKEYIPGYSNDVSMRRTIIQLAEKIDSLEKDAAGKKLLLDNIRQVIDGGIKRDTIKPRNNEKPQTQASKLNPSSEEAKFRQDVEQQDRYDINARFADSRLSEISNYYFFTPLKGKLTTVFNPAERHYGLDIVAPRNESVKATLDGTVIFAGWTSESGHVIHVQHANNLVSVYEHNAVLLKKEGQTVKAGEAIAITGNSGELSTSPHLHFELWYDGKPIDPRDFMVF
jgi:murein DD-endopeptidase MepM/ murein hydrolase activator NlpD